MKASFLFLGVVGCAPAVFPPETALVPLGPETAFECGLREVNQRHYTVLDVDRAAWFIRAERDGGGLGELIRGVDDFDVLTLTVYPLDDGRHELRVVADGYEVERHGEGAGGRIASAPSKTAVRDARAILTRCGAVPPADST